MPFSWRAHDVVEERSELQDLKPAFPKIGISADIAVGKAEEASKFVSEGVGCEIARPENDIMSDGTVRELGAGCEHAAIVREARDMFFQINVLTAGRSLIAAVN